MTTNPFSPSELSEHVAKVEAEEGNTLTLGVESDNGERPTVTLETQGAHDGEKVDVTWGAWAKTQLKKGSHAVGAKIGIRWP